jgi:hypothetical protein
MTAAMGYSARYSEQGSGGKLKTLVVKRPVYTAARELMRKAKTRDRPGPSMAATEKVTKSLEAGNKKAAQFWSEVHLFIVSHDYLEGQLDIIEDDQAA